MRVKGGTMKLKELSIFLENAPGRLYEATHALGETGINLRSLCISDSSDFGVLRILVSEVGAGPVGAIVAAFLAKGGYDVTLCDVVPSLLAPALNPGIRLEGTDTLQAKVARTTTRIDDLIGCLL